MDYKTAKYDICCFFAEDTLANVNVIKNFDNFINSIREIMPLDLKQEGIRYVRGLEIQKIRRTKITSEPVNDILEKSTPYEALSIYITDNLYSKDCPPRLIINIHSTNKAMFTYKNRTANLFFIIGIRKDINYDSSKIFDYVKLLNDTNRGMLGGIFKDRLYLFYGITSIELAYRNLPIEINKIGLDDWNPGFDDIY